MSMRVRAALVVMAIVFAFTAASFALSMVFTRRSMTAAMEQELTLALDIADRLVSTKIELLKSDASTVAERLLKADSAEEMAETMAGQLAEYGEFLSLTVLDKAGIAAHYGQTACSASQYEASLYIQKAFSGEENISHTHYDREGGNFIMHVFVPMGEGRVLSATIPGMAFSDLVSDFRLWQTGYIFMTDAEGTMIAGRDPNMVMERYNPITDDTPDARSAGGFFQTMIESGGRGSGIYTFEGKERFCLYRLVTGSAVGWRIAVIAPTGESPLSGVQTGLLLASLIFLAAGAVVSVFGSGLVSKPFEIIEARGHLLKAGNRSAAVLLSATDDSKFEDSLLEGMGSVGSSLNADRVQIWRNELVDGEPSFVNRYEWRSDVGGQMAEVPIGLHIPYRDKPEWEAMFLRGEAINAPLSALPKEDQELLKIYDIQSIAIIPLFVQDQFWGVFSIDDCRYERVFSEDEIDILRSAGLMIANALLRYQMTQDIKAANDAKSDFLAGMSHEMRTPLNAVIGLSELALEDAGLSEDAYDNLEKICGAGETLLSLVNDILDLSKIEAGRFEIIPAVYDTPSLINDTVTNNILRIGEKPVEFVLTVAEDLPARLCGDELRIKQVLSNLLSNAFKYTKEGKVELGVRCEGDGETVWLTAWVRDTGIGIKPGDIDRLFSNYAQMDRSANRMIEGTGLGLPITKKMVELMDGAVTVESEYGKGSVFTVRIRQKAVNDDVIGAETAENLRNFRYADRRRKKNAKLARIRLPYAHVLVVDDVATNLDVARGLMKPYGMRVDTVTSGRQAIDAIQAEEVRYNAIFMDHMMPGMDGIEAAGRIRALGTEYARNIPIIALTANAIVGNEQLFLSKGFQAFLTKPVNLSRLDAVIRQWVRDKDREEEWAEPKETLSKALSVQIDGVDLEKGLRRFGGDEDSFLQVLRSYAANTRSLLDEIREPSPDGLAAYAVTVHGIKGSSRGICAAPAGDRAEMLEKAAKAGDFAFISQNNAAFIKTAEKLLDGLDTLLQAAAAQSQKPRKKEPDRAVLDRIAEGCKAYQMDTVEAAVKELEGYEYETGGELVAWLWENVEQFNVKEIIEKLSGTPGV